MRTILLVLLTLAVLGGGFFLYLSSDSTPPHPRPRVAGPTSIPAAATSPATVPTGEGIGRGQGVWAKRYDARTGRLTSQFRAAEYEPQPDGTVRVAGPQAEFFLADEQVLRIEGTSGVVAMPESSGRKGGIERGPAAPPSRGEIKDVVVSLLDADGETLLTAKMDNAHFDSDTARIFTESFSSGATSVPADRVPVTVRGRDYDFDGEGLTIRWNERERRLQLLEIAHGRQLVIKNAQQRDMLGKNARNEPRRVSGAGVSPASPKKNVDEASAPPGGDKPATREKSRVYRAILFDNVRLVQGEETLATSGRLRMDYSAEKRTDRQPKNADEASAPPKSGASSQPATLPQKTAPATHESAEPLIVYWTGKLTVAPVEETFDLPAGEAVATLDGGRVTLSRDGGILRCDSAVYRTADGSITLAGSEREPVTLTDARGAAVRTPHMRYLPQRHRAILQGPSSAMLPADAAKDSADRLYVEWAQRCTLDFARADAGNMSIQRAQLTQAVSVEHPQVRLKAASLDLDFDPAGGERAALRNLLAEGDVDCTLSDAEGKTRTLRCQRLNLQTAAAEGKLYPSQIEADGKVLAAEEDQELRAEHLRVTLEPAAAAAAVDARLQRLSAGGNVRVGLRDGTVATADELLVEGGNDKPRLTLRGEPYAQVLSRTGDLSGPVIRVYPDEGRAVVEGAGTLHAVQGADDKTPLDVQWSGGILMDTAAERIRVDGDVRLNRGGPDFVQSARAGKLVLTLADGPATRPATRDAKPANGWANMDLMRGKVVRGLILSEDVRLEALGGGVKQMNLLAGEIRAGIDGQNLTDVHVPAGGKILLIADDTPATAPAQANPTGQLAVEWKKELLYRPSTGRADLTGGVTAVYEPKGEGPQFVRLDADRLTLWLDPDAKPSTNGRPLLRKVSAEAGQAPLTVSGPDIELTGRQVEFDPQVSALTVRGDADRPAVVVRGTSQGSFEEIRYELKNERLTVKRLRANVRR